MTASQCRLVESNSGTDHRGRKHHHRIKRLAHTPAPPKWEASCQGRPPNALGDLGGLDGGLGFSDFFPKLLSPR
jgi:hypothetical protein